jgi:hypothetical protein
MIPTSETGPAGGHSLQCHETTATAIATPAMYVVTTDLAWSVDGKTYSFDAALGKAVDRSHPHEHVPSFVVQGNPKGAIAAIVLRKAVFIPATGQALEPTLPPVPWGELTARIAALETQLSDQGVALATLA